MMTYVYVGLSGFLGAITRIGLGNLLYIFLPKGVFPFHTVVINLIGTYLLALLIGFFSIKKNILSLEVQLALTTGFLGSFTTFSTLSVEALTLFLGKRFFLLGIYLFVSFGGGLLFAWFGLISIAYFNKDLLLLKQYDGGRKE